MAGRPHEREPARVDRRRSRSPPRAAPPPTTSALRWCRRRAMTSRSSEASARHSRRRGHARPAPGSRASPSRNAPSASRSTASRCSLSGWWCPARRMEPGRAPGARSARCGLLSRPASRPRPSASAAAAPARQSGCRSGSAGIGAVGIERRDVPVEPQRVGLPREPAGLEQRVERCRTARAATRRSWRRRRARPGSCRTGRRGAR